jgi:hypothetical protein
LATAVLTFNAYKRNENYAGWNRIAREGNGLVRPRVRRMLLNAIGTVNEWSGPLIPPIGAKTPLALSAALGSGLGGLSPQGAAAKASPGRTNSVEEASRLSALRLLFAAVVRDGVERMVPCALWCPATSSCYRQAV